MAINSSSSIYSSPNPKDYNSPSVVQTLHNELGEENSKRGALAMRSSSKEQRVVSPSGALEMCSSSEEQWVVSSDYFYSTVKKINKTPEEVSLLRPKKFKQLKEKYRGLEEYDKTNTKEQEAIEKYNEIHTKKQEAIKKLKERIEAGKADKEKLKNLLIASARKGIPFSELPLSKFKDRYQESFSRLEKAYEESRKKGEYSIFSKNVKKLFWLINIDHLSKTEYEKLKRDERSSIDLWKKKKYVTEEAWSEQNRSDIMRVIAEIWQEDAQELFKMCLTEKLANLRQYFFSKINEKNEEMAKSAVCGEILELVWGRIRTLEKKEKETNDTIFNKALEKSDDLVKAYGMDFGQDINDVHFLIKEQKQHSFARFGYLAEHYADFIRHAKMIEEIVAKIDQTPNSGAIVPQALTELLKYSHYADLKDQIKDIKAKIEKVENQIQAQTNDNKKKTLEKNKKTLEEQLKPLEERQALLTARTNHHDNDLMGYEKRDYFDDLDKADAIHQVNTIMQLFGTQEEVKQFDHAHTFPFPAMFNWKPNRMIEILSNLGVDVSEKFTSEDTSSAIPSAGTAENFKALKPKKTQRFISSKFFKEMRKGQSSEKLDEAFENELNKIKEEVKDDKAKFVYYALNLLKQYHLRVFSETELLPDFINKYSDQLSEWGGTSEETNSYKKSLALGMIKLLKQDKVTKEIVAECLSDYYNETINKIQQQDEYEKSNDDCTIMELFKKITAFQVEQSVHLAQITTDIEVKALEVKENKVKV